MKKFVFRYVQMPNTANIYSVLPVVSSSILIIAAELSKTSCLSTL